MRRPRPLPLILASLAVIGTFKAGLSLGGAPFSGLLFVAAAEASGSEPETLPEPEAAAAPECDLPEEVLAAVTAERALLDRQKDEMAERAAEVDLAREQLDIEAARLGELKSELEQQLAHIESTHEGDVDRLINLYRNMKPAEAAAIMNELDLEVSVMVLGAMVERDAAPILAQLTPVRAQAISRIIFERARLPGDQRLEGIRVE